MKLPNLKSLRASKMVGMLRRVKLPSLKSRRTRNNIARVLTIGSALMVIGALLFAVYPFYTDYRADNRQKGLAVSFKTNQSKTNYANRQVVEGAPLTKIEIPKLNLKTIVVEGVSAQALSAGSGHYPQTPLPGEPGNVAIAGHSGMHGKPFDRLDILRPGDLIFLETPLGRFTYQVTEPPKGSKNPWIVDPLDWSVVSATTEPSLTLTTCWPRGSAKKRLVTRARLIESSPVS